MPSLPTSLSEKALEQLSQVITRRLGLHFPKERYHDLQRGLARAAADLADSGNLADLDNLGDLGADNIQTLAAKIASGHADQRILDILAVHLTVGETYFFRDKRFLTLLRQEILPDLLSRARREGRRLRVWSAGCCTGEEPYTLAMLLKEAMAVTGQVEVTILATDLNPRFLEKARRGIYSEWSFRQTPSRMRNAWFRPLPDGSWELSCKIRSMVSLGCLNLAVDAYPAMENRTNGQDLILCRNVLIYFSPQLGRQVIDKLYRCLVDGGLLAVSPSEGSLVTASKVFSALPSEHGTVFRRLSCPAPTLEPEPFADRPQVRPFDQAGPGPVRFPFRQHTLSATPVSPRAGQPLVVSGAARPGNLDRSVSKEASTIGQVLEKSHKALERGCHAEAGGYLKAVDKSGLTQAQIGLVASLEARLLAGSGELGKAEQACREAIAADKLHVGHHYLLAVILQEMDRLDEAAQALTRAIYLDQDFVLAHFTLGMLHKEQGRKQAGRKSLENALAGLKGLGRDDLVPASEGMTAGRLTEIIRATLGE